jgi:hypothetical protein
MGGVTCCRSWLLDEVLDDKVYPLVQHYTNQVEYLEGSNGHTPFYPTLIIVDISTRTSQ